MVTPTTVNPQPRLSLTTWPGNAVQGTTGLRRRTVDGESLAIALNDPLAQDDTYSLADHELADLANSVRSNGVVVFRLLNGDEYRPTGSMKRESRL